MLANAYRVFNSAFNPQKEDVNSFFETLDVDRNKKVTLEDMENLCIRYLTGTTIGIPYKFNEQRTSMSTQNKPYWSESIFLRSNQNLNISTLTFLLRWLVLAHQRETFLILLGWGVLLFLSFLDFWIIIPVHSSIKRNTFSTLSLVRALVSSKKTPNYLASLFPSAVVTTCWSLRSVLLPTKTMTTLGSACSLILSIHRFTFWKDFTLVMS